MELLSGIRRLVISSRTFQMLNTRKLTSCVRQSTVSWPLGLASDSFFQTHTQKWYCHHSATLATLTHCQITKALILTSLPNTTFYHNGQSNSQCRFSTLPLNPRNSRDAALLGVANYRHVCVSRSYSNQKSGSDLKNNSLLHSDRNTNEHSTESDTLSDSSSSVADPLALTSLSSVRKNNLASLNDINIDGTIPEGEDDEYEDFYMDYEDIEEDIPELDLPISSHRALDGVFSVEEVVTLLEHENARDVVVVAVPREYKYVDHLVIVSGRSTRHLMAMSERLRWVFKRKRGSGDPKTVKIEGKLTKDWMALDLGNVAVHLFLPETREKYDLETLWTVGADWDPQVIEQSDPFALYVEWDDTVPGKLSEETAADAARSSHQGEAPVSSMESVTTWHGSKTKS